jgi:hypothetical protein
VNGYTFLKNWLFLSGSGLPFLWPSGPKAAKSPRNPKIDAFQELKEKSPRTKGSKKPEKS